MGMFHLAAMDAVEHLVTNRSVLTNLAQRFNSTYSTITHPLDLVTEPLVVEDYDVYSNSSNIASQDYKLRNMPWYVKTRSNVRHPNESSRMENY